MADNDEDCFGGGLDFWPDDLDGAVGGASPPPKVKERKTGAEKKQSRRAYSGNVRRMMLFTLACMC